MVERSNARARGARLLAVLALASGCASEPALVVGYRVPASAVRAAPSDRPLPRLSVLPLADRRSPEEHAASYNGAQLLLAVPFWPYASTVAARNADQQVLRALAPRAVRFTSAGDGSAVAEPAFPHSFAAAIAADLAATGAFADVQLGQVGRAGSAADLVLSGQLLRDEFRVTATLYGLSVGGALLWLLGLPMQRNTGEVELHLALRDARTSTLLWEGAVRGRRSEVRWVYVPARWLDEYLLLPGDDSQTLDRWSPFWWQFEALRDALDQVRGEILLAAEQAARPKSAK